MNKAQIKVELNQLLTIDNVVYHVAEHPTLPGVPYVQRGARGFVIQLQSPAREKFALKYFKLKYRVPELATIGKLIRRYAELPGMRAAARTVFTAQSHVALVRAYPALEYGMLMPWIPGVTWFDLVTRRVAITTTESLQWAQQAVQTLAALESNGSAHCDIAGANVMIERGAARFSLVDIEEMYGPDLPRPVESPAGQDGYQHKASAHNGQWVAEGDRFGGAVLIAELLGWHTPMIRQNSADEHYFAAAEMQQADSTRYKLLHDVLRAVYSPALADLFEAVWRSPTLADCPPLSAWKAVLLSSTEATATRSIVSSALSALSAPPADSGGSIVSGRRALVVPTADPIVPKAAAPIDQLAPAIAATAPTPLANNPISMPGISAAVTLCPNCGAQNPIGAEFCKQCGYYLPGNRRPAATSVGKDNHPAANTVNVAAAAPPLPPGSISPSPAGAPPIVSARRLVSHSQPGQPGQPMQIGPTVPTIPPSLPEATDGRWIIFAVVIGFLITAIILALLAASH